MAYTDLTYDVLEGLQQQGYNVLIAVSSGGGRDLLWLPRRIRNLEWWVYAMDLADEGGYLLIEEVLKSRSPDGLVGRLAI
ncbi:hypothetical protein [Sphingobacterium suaedae]|uniref:Uncharacterized protein n=1 Tax=Sphingobacterium suaedae TaxID=1686402 RepID=A0ABW5KE44_9SPHI